MPKQNGLAALPIIVTAAIVVIVLGVGIWWLQTTAPTDTTPTPTPTTTPTVIPTTTPTPSPSPSPIAPSPTPPTAQYTDTTIGFSLRYPQTWNINEETRADLVRARFTPPTTVTPNTTDNYIRVLAAPAVGHGMEGYQQTSQTTETHGGLTWEITHWRGVQGDVAAITAVHTAPNETDYAIEAYFMTEHEAVFEQTTNQLLTSFSTEG